MSEPDYNKILNEITALKEEMNRRLAELAKDIKSEMKLKHQEIDFQHQDHEKRLSSTEKIIVFIAGAVGIALLGAIFKLIII